MGPFCAPILQGGAGPFCAPISIEVAAGVSHHVDEVPGSDTKFSPRKLTASIFREKTLEITGSLAVNFRGEFSSPVRGGRLAIRKHGHFILKVYGLSLPLGCGFRANCRLS